MKTKARVFVGNRNTGKTTRLYNIYLNEVKQGKRVLVIDSATEHIDKSLLIRIKNLHGGYSIPQCKKELIVFPNIKTSSYPSNIINPHEKLYLCDASYFLEKGYEYQEGEVRDKYRKLYKYYSMQILYLLMEYIDVVLLDEIEFVPESKDVISELCRKRKNVYSTLHEDTSLTNLTDFFIIERT